MPAHVLSLREPRFGSPVAAEVHGDISVAAVASAWGWWSGLEAECPAVVAAQTSLVADARTGETDWRAALVRAFAVASWLEAAASSCDEMGHRIGALIEP